VQHFSLVVDKEGLDAAIDQIWNRLKVRGELQVRPMDGKFRIDVISERDLSAAQLDKLPGKRPG
jgi:hypothetical protein